MVAKTKWYSLQAVSKQLNRKGVGRTNLITILKQEGLLKEDKQPKPVLLKKGLFRVKELQIKPSARSVVDLKIVQISDQGINHIQSVFEKRDVRINKCMLQIQKLAESNRVVIRTKINAI
jgi:phage antirepressor YoqD-like protein